MDLLIANFWGYLQLYQSKIPRIIISGIVIELLVLLIQKMGYLKYKNKSFLTSCCGLLFSFSIAWVINMTILGRTPGTEFAFRFQPFGSYIEAFLEGNVEVLLQIIMNVVMFVPIGLFLPCCFEKFEKNKVLFVTMLACSGGIELIQGVMKIGMFEVDDVLGNVIGAEVGFLIWWGSRDGERRKWKKWRG